MQALVYRQFSQGMVLGREAILRQGPARGTLSLRLRLIGRNGARWNVYLAALAREDDSYVIPCLDGAVVTQIRGRWLHLAGMEVVPRSTSLTRPNPDCYPQEWWCRLG